MKRPIWKRIWMTLVILMVHPNSNRFSDRIRAMIIFVVVWQGIIGCFVYCPIWIFLIIAVVYAVALFLPIDPGERRAGTWLSAALAEVQDTDWAFLAGPTQIYLETRTPYGIRHSITTQAWATNGVLYVGCLDCDIKYWSYNVNRDNHVRLQIAGEIYHCKAIVVTSDEWREVLGLSIEMPILDAKLSRKHIPKHLLSPDIVVYKMEPVVSDTTY